VANIQSGTFFEVSHSLHWVNGFRGFQWDLSLMFTVAGDTGVADRCVLTRDEVRDMTPHLHPDGLSFRSVQGGSPEGRPLEAVAFLHASAPDAKNRGSIVEDEDRSQLDQFGNDDVNLIPDLSRTVRSMKSDRNIWLMHVFLSASLANFPDTDKVMTGSSVHQPSADG
jgi:hypothetical protein